MFIVIDGADGTYKTTCAKSLSKYLNAVYTFEPTQKIPKSGNLLDFFLEDRKKHQIQIKKWLDEGKNIVCDRYKYSTIVYQQLEGYSEEDLISINSKFIVPDITFIFDSTLDRVMKAIELRGKDFDVFETREIQGKVLNLFRGIPKIFPNERIVLIG
jgi:dTMP kinase